MDELPRIASRELRQMIKVVNISPEVGSIVEVIESVTRMCEVPCSDPNSTTKQMDKWLMGG